MNPLDPLIFAGNVLDTPWAMGRAALAGRNPLEGVFDVEKRTSGRDMLESWGLLGANQEGFDAGDVAGFAVEMLDPLSLATGMWAPKAIRAMKGAKALGGVDEVADAAKVGGALVPRISEPMLDPTVMKPFSAIPAANPGLPPTPGVIPLPGPGMPLLNPPVPPFYSRLERAAQQLPGQNFKAQSLPNMLKKAPEGVSQEEMDWVLKGLPKQGVVKKDELLRTIDEGGIKIEEKLLGGPEVVYEYVGPGHTKTFPTLAEAEAYNNQWPPGMRSAGGVKEVQANPVKWEGHKVPGGANYKELLLKRKRELPPDSAVDTAARQLMDDGGVDINTASRDVIDSYRNVARQRLTPQDYTSSHWDDDPNVLAHVRFDDRIAPDGKKTLFVQELQSDWHQAARTRGYSPEENAKLIPQHQAKLQEAGAELDALQKPWHENGVEYWRSKGVPDSEVHKQPWREGNPYYDQYRDEMKNRTELVDAAKERFDSLKERVLQAKSGPVPDAPFKSDEWANLALKRVLQYATDNGYERIAINSGDLAAKFNAGGAEGKVAEGIAKWYDETLPNMLGKMLKKHGGKQEPFYISRGVPGKNVPRTGEFELDDVMEMLDDAPPPFNPKDPGFSKSDWGMAFRVPNAAKQEIAHKGLPLLNVAPQALGATILGTNDENDPTRNALGLALLGGSVAGSLGMSLMRPNQAILRAGAEAAESAKGVNFGKSLWDVPPQAITSAKTSINSKNLPKVFSSMIGEFRPGTTNLDIGGGRFDNVDEFLKTKNARNLVFDPFNRQSDHNAKVLQEIAKTGGADTATVSNVLNVIAEPTNRLKVIVQAKDALKPGGRAMFSVYEGNKTGIASSTKQGFQLNQSSEFYLPLVESVFGKENVTATKGVIVATKPSVKQLSPPMPPRTLSDYQRIVRLAMQEEPL